MNAPYMASGCGRIAALVCQHSALSASMYCIYVCAFQSLIIWSALPVICLLLTLMIFLFYFCYRCCQRSPGHRKGASCLKCWMVFFVLLAWYARCFKSTSEFSFIVSLTRCLYRLSLLSVRKKLDFSPCYCVSVIEIETTLWVTSLIFSVTLWIRECFWLVIGWLSWPLKFSIFMAQTDVYISYLSTQCLTSIDEPSTIDTFCNTCN